MDSRIVYILLDADVVIHFYKADRLSVLQQLYKGRLLVLDLVLEELMRNKTIAPHVENFLRFKVIQEYTFPSQDEQIFKEYAFLRQRVGDEVIPSQAHAICIANRSMLDTRLKSGTRSQKSHRIVVPTEWIDTRPNPWII